MAMPSNNSISHASADATTAAATAPFLLLLPLLSPLLLFIERTRKQLGRGRAVTRTT